MKSNSRKSSSDIPSNLDLFFPDSWHDLDQGGLKFLFRLIAGCRDRDELKVLYLLRYNSARVLGLDEQGLYTLSIRGRLWRIDPMTLAEAIEEPLAWLDKWPDHPVRINRIGRHRAVAADFSGVSFEDWLIVDSLYQAYIESQDDERLDDMTEVLYGKRMTLLPYLRVSVFFWVASLKEMFSRRFPNFLRPASTDGEGRRASQEDSVNAQIRALTKGDISKRDRILSMDCHIALTELDALAREYEEMRRKYPENG